MSEGVNVGTAYLEVIPSAKGFTSKLQGEVGSQTEKVGAESGKRASKGFGGTFGAGLKNLFAVAGGVAVGQQIVTFFRDANAEARESQKVNALTAQVIKTTGGAAQVTAAQVGDLAGALSNKTGIDDEVIQSGANLLLTFKNIRNEVGKGNDIFNQATAAANDMSASLGQDMKSSSIQLGKALNDPIKGITALSRVGVSFTKQQKEQIKSLVESGDKMGAQKIILKELNSEFGGAAAAATNPAEKAAVAWGNLKEKIGTLFLPILDKVATVISTKVVPFVTELVDQFTQAMGGGNGFAASLKDMQPFLSAVGSLIGFLAKVAIPAIVAQFKFNARVMGIVGRAFQALASAGKSAWDKLKSGAQAVADAFRWLWSKAIRPVVSFILGGFAVMLDGLARFARAVGWKDLARKASNAADAVRGLKNEMNGLKDKTVHLTVVTMQKKVGSAQGGKVAAELDGMRAGGGPVSSGRTYLVGERGPELFTTSQSGRIIPNHALAAATTDRGNGGRTPVRLIVEDGRELRAYLQENVSAALEFAS